MSPLDQARSLLPALRAAVREAGALAVPYFRAGRATTARTWSKAGGSPVTEADVAVDTFLKIRLSALLPEAGWLSEETADDPARLRREHVWIVDPIDGTRAFLSGHPDWSIACALLSDGRPTVGIVYAPVHGPRGTLYEAILGEGARRDDAPIQVSARATLAGATVAGPKPLVDRLERARRGAEPGAAPMVVVEKIPSLALRLARVADGSVDVGVISSDARDWDLAASDLILHEAGGTVGDGTGRVPLYNRADPVHGELFAASLARQRQLIAALGG